MMIMNNIAFRGLLNMKISFIKKCFVFTYIVLLTSHINLYPIDTENVYKLRHSFLSVNLEDKLQILKAKLNDSSKELVPLYYDAINYFQNSYEVLKDNSLFLDIGIIAINKMGELKEKSAVQDIRYLFSIVENEDFKIECLKTLSVIIEKDAGFITYLNSRYETGLNDLLDGKVIDIRLLISYAQVLGNFADVSSFEFLFKTLLYPVSENLKKAVKEALNNISFNYFYEIIGKFQEKNIQYIYTLYLLAKENKKIPSVQLGEITEKVLSYALSQLDVEPENAEKLILQTLPVLSELKWSRASTDVNKVFYFEQSKYNQINSSSEILIRVIDCMGNLATSESAKNLSIFLDVLNSKTEKTKQYSEPLMLSVIMALGRLGDCTAFDYLLHVEYLGYSEKIKQAARSAIEELNWQIKN